MKAKVPQHVGTQISQRMTELWEIPGGKKVSFLPAEIPKGPQHSLIKSFHNLTPFLVGCENCGRSSRSNGIFLFPLPESINFHLDFIGLGLVELAAYFHAEPQWYVLLHWGQCLPSDLVFPDVTLIEKISLWSWHPPLDDLGLDLGVPIMFDIRLDWSHLLWGSSGKV